MVNEERISEIIDSVYKDDRKTLMESESKDILKNWDIPVVDTRLAETELEAVEMAQDLKYPVVMKIASPDIENKSVVEGIRIGVTSEIEVRQAFEDLKINAKSYNSEAEIRGVLVQSYVPDAQEVVTKITWDQSFGYTVLFGLGGVWFETLEDISYRLAPISVESAKEMMKEIEGYPILSGSKGGMPVDIQALAEIISKTSKLSDEIEKISEIALDPIFVFEQGEGAIVVDVSIKLE